MWNQLKCVSIFSFVLFMAFASTAAADNTGSAANAGRNDAAAASRTFPPIDYDAMLRRRMERFHQQWIDSDEKWTILEPLLWRVLSLREALRPAANAINRAIDMSPMRPGEPSRDRVREGTGQIGNPNPEIGAAYNQLLDVYRNPESTDEQITEKLLAYRTVRLHYQDELEKAQEQLREQLSLVQQAVLTIDGVLD